MDGLTFTADVVKALAWPVTVFASLCLFRRPLARLLPSLKQIKYKDFELDFSRRLEETAAEASALPGPAVSAPVAPSPNTRLVTLAQASPTAAINEAWLGVEAAARQSGQSGPEDPHQAAVFRDLRALRNSAARAISFEPSPEVAAEYVRVAGRLEQSLRAVRPAA